MKLEDLPVELLSHILGALDDLPALLSAIQASRTLHDTFLVAKQIILSSILVRQVGADLMQAALMAVDSSKETSDAPGTTIDSRAAQSSLLKLDQVVAIARLNVAVSAFTELFIQYATRTQPALHRGLPLRTGTETTRIARTFYYFETFRNWFGDSSDARIPLERRLEVFFSAFTPWEVEQLGCIHDFLFHQIKPAYDDIVIHDVQWGSLEVEPALNYGSWEVQSIMSRGLGSVHKLASAKTYEQRHRLLYKWNGPVTKRWFLYHALQRYSGSPSQQSRPEAPNSRDAYDSGPRDAWEWAYAGVAPRAEAYRLDRTKLREWGYVFWDRSRLEAMGLFDEPFDPPRYVRQEHEVDEEMEESWRARAAIANAGGTGYWSATDQSRVVYPASRQQQAKPSASTGWPRGRPTWGNSRERLEAESVRIAAALGRKG